jgi:basic membrane protein A
MGAVAKRFPNTRFAIVDVANGDLAGKPKNVLGLLFREEQVGYLAGYLAGLEA